MAGRDFLSNQADHVEASNRSGSDRRFGGIVGGLLIVIGCFKASVAGTIGTTAVAIGGAGALLLLVGLAAPARLAPLHRLWLRLGDVMAVVMNPVILALLFVAVITPTALIMRLLGKRPLRLLPDRAAASYWIARDPPEAAREAMRRQF